MNKKVFLSLLLLVIVSSNLKAQLSVQPVIGSTNIYYPISVSVTDTGTVGNNQIWDYSGFSFDQNQPDTMINRAPSSSELTLHPNINLVVESSNGVKDYFFSSSDSMVLYYTISEIGNAISYSDPQKIFNLPLMPGIEYSDSLKYSYDSNGTLIEVIGFTTWMSSGFGTLITPLSTYNGVTRVSRHAEYDVFVDGAYVLTLNGSQYSFHESTHGDKLLDIMYDEYNDIINAIFTNSPQSSAGISANGSDLDIRIYPNPTNAYLNLSKVCEYRVFSIEGSLLCEGKGQSLSVADLTSGTYYIQLNDGSNKKTISFVKE